MELAKWLLWEGPDAPQHLWVQKLRTNWQRANKKKIIHVLMFATKKNKELICNKKFTPG